MMKDKTKNHSKSLSKKNKIIQSSLKIFEMMKSTFMPSLKIVAKRHNLKNGLYYIVLIDISGSSIASDQMYQSKYPGWINDFTRLTKKALDFSHRNDAAYGLSCGDGSLFLFRNFDDILEWRTNTTNLCTEHNKKCKSGKIDVPEYHNKIIVHLGEVDFDKDDEDPKSFAVNIVFKIEKKFVKNDFGVTEAVKQAILPEIRSGRFGIKKGKKFVMDKKQIVVQLWKIII